MKLEFSRQFFKKIFQISNSMKIRPAEAEFFHADGQTDTHDEANTRCSQFGEGALYMNFLFF